jgi:hypothetical protein
MLNFKMRQGACQFLFFLSRLQILHLSLSNELPLRLPNSWPRGIDGWLTELFHKEQEACLWMFWESRWPIHVTMSMLYHSQYYVINSKISEWDHESNFRYPDRESGTDGSNGTQYIWCIDGYRSRIGIARGSMTSIKMCQDHADIVFLSKHLLQARILDLLPTLLGQSVQWIWKPPCRETSPIQHGEVCRTREHTLRHW